MLNIKSFLLTSILPAVMIVTGSYQVLMGLNGPEGRERAGQLSALATERQAVLDELKAQRQALEDRADRLVTASLDEDLLEESVRAHLGHMRPGEYRIPASELDEVAAIQLANGEELTSLIAVALLEGAGV